MSRVWRWALVALLGLTLAGCGSSVEIEDVDGTECAVARRNLNDRVTAISCDWDEDR